MKKQDQESLISALMSANAEKSKLIDSLISNSWENRGFTPELSTAGDHACHYCNHARAIFFRKVRGDNAEVTVALCSSCCERSNAVLAEAFIPARKSR